MRLARVLVLALVGSLAVVLVPDALAIRFADTPCPEAGAGGLRVCPVGLVGTSYAIKLDGAGGCGPDPNVLGSGLPYQFRLLSGQLPAGLTLRKDGLLSGIPTAAGSWSFWLELSDENPPSASWCIPKKSEREFTVRVGAPPAEVGTPYLLALGAVGDGPQRWSIAWGQLPRGLALESATGSITGTPEIAGSFPVKLSVIDSKGRTQAVELMIKVSPKLAFATMRLAVVRVGRRYRSTVRTSGGLRPVRLKILSGRFPIGVRLNVNTGVLSGRPRKAGVYRIAIEARDALGSTARRIFVFTVRPQSP
jgi:hypothetical protein